jgi:hypothetical protein
MSVEIYIPSQVLEQLETENEDALRERAMAAVDELQVAITQAVPRLAAVANAEGGRLMTAAAFMLRANDLLRGARATEREVEVCVLALRTVLELSIIGRYLVVGPHAGDEFSRRVRDGHALETKLAAQVGSENAPLPEFLEVVAVETTKSPRQLSTLAEELDQVDGRAPEGEGSALYCYRLLYKHVSNVLTHANALSIKRYTHREGDVLTLHEAGEPAIRLPNVLAASCLLYDLARDVLGALDVSTEDLPTVLSRSLPTVGPD